mgnify:CR=1 FL=1
MASRTLVIKYSCIIARAAAASDVAPDFSAAAARLRENEPLYDSCTNPEMLEERQVIVPSINIVHSILLVGAALPGAWALSSSIDGPMLIAALVLLGLVLVSCGDLIPRAIGRRNPRSLAYRLSPILALFVKLGSQAAEIMSDDDRDPA